jgi:hypothetical protein
VLERRGEWVLEEGNEREAREASVAGGSIEETKLRDWYTYKWKLKVNWTTKQRCYRWTTSNIR